MIVVGIEPMKPISEIDGFAFDYVADYDHDHDHDDDHEVDFQIFDYN